MQISPQTLENTYPTCNYVNCLWLVIQLFTLVFAHAFICHIRGWQRCPESGGLSLQALWTDNRQGENPPLQSCAASWPAHSTQHHMESDCFEEACVAPHTAAQQGAHARSYAQVHTLDLTHARTQQLCFLVSCCKSRAGDPAICRKCSFMLQIFSGNKWHSKSNVPSNLCCLVRRKITFWRAILDNKESNLHEEHWRGEGWRKDMQLRSRTKQSLIAECRCKLKDMRCGPTWVGQCKDWFPRGLTWKMYT